MNCKRIKLRTKLINWILKESKLMATIEEVQNNVIALSDALTSVDLKLDEVRAFIASLQAGQPVTQEQLDNLAAAIASAKSTAQAVLSEADALDNP